MVNIAGRAHCLVVRASEREFSRRRPFEAVGELSDEPPTSGWKAHRTRLHESHRHLENCIASTNCFGFNTVQATKGPTVDALALGADEGRGRLR